MGSPSGWVLHSCIWEIHAPSLCLSLSTWPDILQDLPMCHGLLTALAVGGGGRFSGELSEMHTFGFSQSECSWDPDGSCRAPFRPALGSFRTARPLHSVCWSRSPEASAGSKRIRAHLLRLGGARAGGSSWRTDCTLPTICLRGWGISLNLT